MEDLRGELHQALTSLRSATGAYARACADLSAAETAHRDAQATLEAAEGVQRDNAYRSGLPGSNEGARTAALREIIAQAPGVALARAQAARCAAAKDSALATYRAAEAHAKAERAIVTALTALVMPSGF